MFLESFVRYNPGKLCLSNKYTGKNIQIIPKITGKKLCYVHCTNNVGYYNMNEYEETGKNLASIIKYPSNFYPKFQILVKKNGFL